MSVGSPSMIPCTVSNGSRARVLPLLLDPEATFTWLHGLIIIIKVAQVGMAFSHHIIYKSRNVRRIVNIKMYLSFLITILRKKR